MPWIYWQRESALCLWRGQRPQGTPVAIQRGCLFRGQGLTLSGFQSCSRAFIRLLNSRYSFPRCEGQEKGSWALFPGPQDGNSGGKGHLFLCHKRKLIHQFSSKGISASVNRGIAKTLSAVLPTAAPPPRPRHCNGGVRCLFQVKRDCSGLLLIKLLPIPVKMCTPKPSSFLLFTGENPREREREESKQWKWIYSHSSDCFSCWRIFHITGFSFSSVLLIHPKS